MIRTNRYLGTIATTVAAIMFATACGGSGSSGATGTPIEGGTIVIAEGQDTTETDPAVSSYDISWRIQDLVYETLVSTDAESNPVPEIAESWQQPSPTRYVFSLREGVTFSNGRVLDANDVAGSINRILDPATGSYWASQLGPVTSVTALDAKTVQIDLAAPYTPLLTALANTTMAILPMQELSAGSFDPKRDYLGSGPFVVADHVQDQGWTFTKNLEYWNADSVGADGVEIKVLADDATRVAALRDGSVDLASFASPDAPALLSGIPNVTSLEQKSSDMYWLQLNSIAPNSPFTDQRVRQAVAYALDRQSIIDTALAGVGQPTGLASPNLPGSCDPANLPFADHDVDKAKALLSEAGVTDLSFDMISPPYSSTFSNIAQVVQQNLAEAGITVNIQKPEMGAYFDQVYVQQPGAFESVVDSFAGYSDPTMVMQFLLTERNATVAGFVQPNPELTEVVDQATSEAAGDDRAEKVATACDIVATDAQIIPLTTKSTTIGVRSDQIAADVPSFDSYDIYFRNIASYGLLGK